MLEIEFEEPHFSTCECCGEKSVSLTRFVYNDEGAYAVYYIKFTEHSDEKFVSGIISIGDWGTDEEPKNRVAFPFRIWTNQENYQVGLVDKTDSLWNHEMLGKILDRDEALNHPWKKEVFHITDHIVIEDQIVIDFLA